jgi:hypothetical protein
MSTTATTEQGSPAEVAPLAAPESPDAPTRPRPPADVARSSRRAATARHTGAHASVVHAHSHRTATRREPIRRADPE